MQDDFGDFLQAPAPNGHKANFQQNQNVTYQKQFQTSAGRPINDLNAKIQQSFDLKTTSQKASLKFQQPQRNVVVKRPTAQYKLSSQAANWSNLDVKTSDFTIPTQELSHHNMPMPQITNFHSNYGVPMQPNQLGAVIGHNTTHQSNNANVLQQPITSYVSSSALHPPKMHQTPDNQFSQQNISNANEMWNKPAYWSVVPDTSPTHQQNFAQQTFPLSKSVTPPVDIRNSVSLPPWMTIPDRIPNIFKVVLKLSATSSSFADTAKLYPILLSSGLSRDMLGHIWMVANRSTPGQLTFTEVYIALSLIALAQKGDPNLTFEYVASLNAAPIPILQLPAKTSHVGGTEMGMELSKYNSTPSVLYSNVAVSQQAASAQSVTPVASSTSLYISNNNNMKASTDFDEFQEFQANTVIFSASTVPNSLRNPSNSAPRTDFGEFSRAIPPALHSEPDRSLINSPLSRSFTDSKQHSQPTVNNFSVLTLGQGNISNGRNALPVKAEKPSVSSSENNGPMSKPVVLVSNKVFGGFEINMNTSSENSQSTGNISWQTPGSSIHPASNLFDDDAGKTSMDKYSVLRDIFPTQSNETKTSSDNEFTNTEFTDFHTATPATSETASNVSNVLGVAVSVNVDGAIEERNGSTGTQWKFDASGICSPGKNDSIFAQKTLKGDASSVNSLELPNLSQTKCNLSADSLSSLRHDDTNSINISLNDSNSAFINTNKEERKDSNHKQDEHPPFNYKPASSVRRPRRSTRTSDDDFGDFSVAPPPIDDTTEQYNTEFDLYQGGNSSLVDFDVFDHFEETWVDRRKNEKKESNGTKNKREDSTAFSEFVKANVEAVTSNFRNQVDDNSPSEKKYLNCDKNSGDWSAFDSAENVDDVEERNVKNIQFCMNERNGDTISHEAETVVVKQPVDVSKDFAAGPKTFTSTADYFFQEKTSEAQSEFDREAEELKARMEGTEVSDPKELYLDHWSRCLATCKDIIVSTGDIFAALKSPATCHEIVNSARGRDFICDTSEVYGIARRIQRGMESIELTDDDIQQTMKDIEIAWNNLLGFCPYTPSVHKTPEHCYSSASKDLCNVNGASLGACSLCLLSTKDNNLKSLSYGGKYYHAPCANLWLNQVAPILPRLDLPRATP